MRRPLDGRICAAAAGSRGRQPGVQRGRAGIGQLGLQRGTQRGVGAGELEMLQHRPDVEAGAADQ